MIKTRTSSPQAIAMTGGILMATLIFCGIFFGSGRLTRFDSPLAAYSAATVLAGFAFSYRYLMWIQRPATWRYFLASLKLFFRPKALVRNSVKLVGLLWNNIIRQKFIDNRSHSRWMAHMGMAWGCLLAFAITFPLSWGWVQFGAAPDGHRYTVEFMGMTQFAFDPNGPIGFLMFNGLNISAVLVLTGVAMAMHRRIFQAGAQAVQTLENDLIPLILLFAVSITGLMITASYRLMGGANFGFISLLHAFTVIILLLWMPFGKLFHVIQRPAQLGVAYYKEEGLIGPKVTCARSGEEYQSKLHHDDLVEVMKEVGTDFGDHQNLSPQEKRKLIALNQIAEMEGQPFVG
ncbi:MAG: MFS transporter [Armatimonadetes bacterium]|nr:MFS transporter [Armatimonadota bacterium]